MSDPKRRELRHLICGTFTFDPETLALAVQSEFQRHLIMAIHRRCRELGFRQISASFSSDPGTTTSVLRVVVEEFDPHGEGPASSQVAAATPDDEFAQRFVHIVVAPAMQEIFGVSPPFVITPSP